MRIKPLTYDGSRFGTVLALNHGHHDNTMAVLVDGQVSVMLELERLFESRYFVASEMGSWTEPIAVRALLSVSRQQGDLPREPFCWDAMVSVDHRFNVSSMLRWICAKSMFRVRHQVSHALLVQHDSPVNSLLLLSYDGGVYTHRCMHQRHGWMHGCIHPRMYACIDACMYLGATIRWR